MICRHGKNSDYDSYCPDCEVDSLRRKVHDLDQTIREWEECGDNIMEFITGSRSPLSDSDVIGYIEELAKKYADLKTYADSQDIRIENLIKRIEKLES